ELVATQTLFYPEQRLGQPLLVLSQPVLFRKSPDPCLKRCRTPHLKALPHHFVKISRQGHLSDPPAFPFDIYRLSRRQFSESVPEQGFKSLLRKMLLAEP